MTRAEISDRLRTERERVVVKESQTKHALTTHTAMAVDRTTCDIMGAKKGRRGRCKELSSIALFRFSDISALCTWNCVLQKSALAKITQTELNETNE
jgi:hypothetical protein